ncbi:mRNA interferase YafQ [uncultured Eubacterium sp.]|nr:mRNA interferase YafQ [uncultured Eubacterium sp.]
MLDIILSNRFKRDLKLAAKRGYRLELLDEVVERLARQEELAPKFRDHELSGSYAGFRECHIQPDWLLVYRVENSELILFLSRTGTHSDLF